MDVEPYETTQLRFHGLAVLPYVPDALAAGGRMPTGLLQPYPLDKQARLRGEFSGAVMFYAAIHVSTSRDEEDFFELTGKYRASRFHLVNKTCQVQRSDSPRVWFGPQSVFVEDHEQGEHNEEES